MALFGYKGYGLQKKDENNIFSDNDRRQRELNKKADVQKENVSSLDFAFGQAKEKASNFRKEDYINKVNVQEKERGRSFFGRVINDTKESFKSNIKQSKGFKVRPKGGFRL